MAESANTTKLENLEFKTTMNPTTFMRKHGVDKIDIVRNPKTNKLFFVTSNSDVSGKVSDAYKENPVISLCVDKTTNDQFFMLHKQSADNIEDTFVL
jgi:hypothetical protein